MCEVTEQQKVAESGLLMLKPREQAFVRAYFDAESPTFGRGGPSAFAAGYSQEKPHDAAWRLLHQNADIRRWREENFARMGATPDELIRRLAWFVHKMDIADFEPVLEGESLKTLRDSGVDTRAIKELKQRQHFDKDGNLKSTTVTLRLEDRLGCMRLLSDILGLKEQAAALLALLPDGPGAASGEGPITVEIDGTPLREFLSRRIPLAPGLPEPDVWDKPGDSEAGEEAVAEAERGNQTQDKPGGQTEETASEGCTGGSVDPADPKPPVT